MSRTKSASSVTMAIVSLRWNGGPLATRAVPLGEEVVLGDARGSIAPLPSEALGAAALVIADTWDRPHVRVPGEKVAKVSGPSGVRLVAGPARVALDAGEEASVMLGAFEVVVAAHRDEPEKKPRRKLAAGAWAHTAVVASIHAALLFAGSRSALASSIEADEGPDLDMLRGYLAAAEERSSAQDRMVFHDSGQGGDSNKANGHAGNGKNGGGERHAGEAGKAGSTNSRAANKRWGAEGAPAKSIAVPEVDSLEDARDFGMAGLLRAANGAAVRPIAGASPWGSEDAFTAMGGMLGRSLGESEGALGLALSGIGEGGGGSGEGIGLGTIGTIGHTDGIPGLGTGGIGTARIGLGRIGTVSWDSAVGDRIGHRVQWTRCSCETSVSGRLPPEAVQRIVRQNFGRFRACYQKGLERNPALAGRVATRFVIGHDGSVVTAGDGGSDLPDEGVRACVHRAFMGVSFPQPEGGVVSVVYPIVFSKVE